MKIVLLPALLCMRMLATAQVGVNTDGSAPHASAMLDVKSTTKGVLLPRMTYDERMTMPFFTPGLMVYQTNSSTTPSGFYIYTGVGWRQIARVEDLSGGNSWTLSASNHLHSNHGGNVGIGVTAPAYKLDVAGRIHSASDIIADGNVGIGTSTPIYKLQVTDGSMAIFNSSDSKTWYFNYSSGGNYFQLSEGGNPRIAVLNGGNVGIGNTAPTEKLHVTGSGRFTDNLIVDDNVTVDNHVTVDGGKGIIRNTGAGQLKYYTREAAFTISLPAHSASVSTIYIAFGGGFTSTPVAFVGNIVTSGGATGELYRCILQLYNVTAAGCNAKIINTDSVPINQNITWNIICIGQ